MRQSLWAMDEVHFQQYGSRCRMWIPPEVKDPVLPHHPTRKSVGYFGAVRLRDGKFLFAREHNRFDAMTTWDFLRLLHRRGLKSRRRVVVITDNAKYHHAKLHSAWRQEHEPQFHLDYLPPYSPDLNPTISHLFMSVCIVHRERKQAAFTANTKFGPITGTNNPPKAGPIIPEMF